MFTWRWIFYINVPIGIIGVLATLRYLPDKIRITRGAQRFDPAGAIVLCAGLTSLMLGMTFGQEAGWDSPVIIGLFSAFVVLLIVFVMVEKRVEQPIVDLSLFRNRLFAASLVSSFLSFLALFAVMFLMPFYLEELRGFTPDHAGLLLTAVPLAIGVVSPLSGWLSDIMGSRLLSSLGLAIGCAGLWFLSNLDHADFRPLHHLAACSCRVGAGALSNSEQQRDHGVGTDESVGDGFRFSGNRSGFGAGIQCCACGRNLYLPWRRRRRYSAQPEDCSRSAVPFKIHSFMPIIWRCLPA